MVFHPPKIRFIQPIVYVIPSSFTGKKEGRMMWCTTPMSGFPKDAGSLLVEEDSPAFGGRRARIPGWRWWRYSNPLSDLLDTYQPPNHENQNLPDDVFEEWAQGPTDK
jgi:hypothetical protein